MLQSRRPVSLTFLLVASITLQAIPTRGRVVFARSSNVFNATERTTVSNVEAAPNVALPTIAATMTDAIVPTDDGDGKADPGGTEKIQYTVNISNSGSDATGVQFNDVLDTHTTLVGGSLNASPLAGDDAFTAIGNTLLVVGTVPSVSGPRKTIAGNVLTNDTEFLGDTFTISAFDAGSANGGTINMVTTGVDAGSFSYISAANFTGTDTFTYTIRDDGIDGNAGNGDDLTSVGTVTITVANQVWYVDNSAAAGGNGRSTTPFDALADVTGATGPDTTGDIIFLRTGSGNYTGGITLLVGQTLWGENDALIVDTFTLQAAGSDPVITNAAGDGVTLPTNGNNLLKGFTVGNTTGYDVASTITTSVGALNISNVILNGTGGLLRADSGGGLTVTFESAGTTSASANGLQLGNTSGSVTISAGSISGVTGTDVLISGGTVSLSCAGNITHTSSAAMVSVSGGHTTGTITFSGTLNASAGTGLQFDNADSTTSYNFNGTNTLSGGDAGVDILNGSSGTFSFSSNTSISNPTGIAFNVSASNPTVTYSGSITTNANRPVSISNGGAAACGTSTFQTGNITANSGSNGILVNNCNSGTITFSGPAVSLTTTTNAGVTLTNNAGASIFFTSGNLDVLTTTGKAFTATGGGLIKVTGSGNTLATESDGAPAGGMILEIQNTTITSGGLNFVSLTGHGASSTTKGVYLLNAGAGGLTVTGTGSTAGSGGTITNYTQKGIHVDNTNNISLSNMNLAGNGTANLATAAICGDGLNGTNTNCAAGIDLQTVSTITFTGVHVSGGVQMGINGKNLTNMTLTNVEVNNAGNEVHEDGIQIHNLFGTTTWNNINIHDNAARQVEVQTASGSNNLTITNSFFTALTFQSSTLGAQGILFSGQGTANITLTVLDSYFKNTFGTAIQSDTNNSAVANVTIERATMEDVGGTFIAASSGSGDFTYAFRDSTTWSDPIHVNSGTFSMFKGFPASGDFRGEITGNTFGKPGLAMSGAPCSGCNAIQISNADAPSGVHEVLIQNNTIQRTGGGAINVTSGSGTGNDGSTMRVKILNNIIKDPDNATGALAITVVNATSPGDDTQTCAQISGNNIQDAAGGGMWNSAATIRLRHVQNNTVYRLPGYTGGATDTTAVQNFLTAQNTLPAGYGSAVALGIGSFGNTIPAGDPCFLLLADGSLSPTAAGYFSDAFGVYESSTLSLLTRRTGLTASLSNPPAKGQSETWLGVSPNVTALLSRQQLEEVVLKAIQRWQATGLTSQQLAALRAIEFDLADLGSSYLGEAANNRVLIDRDAGGQGWYIGSDWLSDTDFKYAVSGTRRYADPTAVSAGRIDLLTAIEHEMGHRLGLQDSYAARDRDNIMYGYLSLGERRLPVIRQAAGVAVDSLAGTHHLKVGTRDVLTKERETAPGLSTVNAPLAPPCVNDSANVCVPIGDLRNGDSVTITFQVTVNSPPNLSLLNPPRVSNQGSVSYNESGAAVLTDDTSVVGAANPNETNVDLFDTTTSVITSGSPTNQGDAVTFTATVAESPAQTPDPTGTVQFLDGVTPLTCSEGGVNGIRPLSGGTAACTTSALSAAAHTINANYSGDGNFDSSSGNVSQTVIACTTNPIVTSTADNGAGTLREAVTNVCNGSTITFNIAGAGPHTILLTTGELVVARNVTINNNSGESVTVSGNNVTRVFNINLGKTATIRNLNVTDGSATGATYPDGHGGAILNEGTLNVLNSTISDSTANEGGGGIYNKEPSASLTVINSTFTGNSTVNVGSVGGGINNNATMTVINSTFSGNSALGGGGGIFNNIAGATITNCTIVSNTSTSNGGGVRADGSVTLRNTIVANNTAAPDVSGVFDTTNGFNLIEDPGLVVVAANNITGQDPVLGPLANNGGPTMTHALLATSPAVEAGSNANLPVDTFDLDGDANTAETLPVDQRGVGYPRTADSADVDTTQTVDIGAFELHPSIEDITDKTTAEDTAVPQITFNLGDGTGALIGTVTATSSNQTLVPDGNILVGGSGSTRTLDITAAANANSPADGTATITVTVTATNGRTAVDTFVVTVTEVNDAPVPTNDTVTDVAEDSSTYVIPFATLLANDTNKGAANESSQTLNITAVSSPTGGSVVINGTNVEFTPTAEFFGPAGFTYTVTDDGTTNTVLDAKTGNATVSFNVTAVNDPPSFTIAGNPPAVNEDAGAQTVNSFATSISAGPGETQTLTFNLSPTGTTGNLSFASGPAIDSSTGNLTYTSNADTNGTASFSVTLSDNGGGTDTSGAQSFTITVNAVDDAPTFQIASNPPAVNEDAGAQTVNSFATNFQPGPVTATDEGTQTLVGYTLTPTGTTGGLTFSGTPAIDTAGTLTYTATNNTSGTASFDAVATDSGSNTPPNVNQSAPVSFTITVNAANDAPVNTVPGPQGTAQNTALVFSSGNGNQISVADADAGTNTVQVTLSVTNGTLTLNGTTGLNFGCGGCSGDGTTDATMTFQGTLTDINSALNGLTFNPTAGYSGPATLTIVSNDLGNTGSGGPQSDTDVVNITVSSNISVNDASVGEPASPNTIDMVFTMSLQAPAPGPISVNFTTQDEPAGPGKAVAGVCGSGGDYVLTSGTVNFAAGQQVKTINVPVCADGTVEPDETFLVNLSSPVNATIADGTATGTIKSTNPAGAVLISELRTSGPGGAGDDFVEIYNNSNSPLTVAASDASAGYGLYKMGADCNATPILIGVIPNGTVIPARGHYLFVGSAYSLTNYGGTGAAAGNLLLTADIETDGNVGLFSTSNLAGISSVNRLDAVGFGVNTGGACDLLREGSTLPPIAGNATIEHSYFRKMCDWIQGSGCTVPGVPKDTNDNSVDFWLADTAGSAITGRLGAPGPENLASPIRRDSANNPGSGGISVFLLDGTVGSAAAPNRERKGVDPPSTFGSMTLRYRVTNNTGGNVTRLRYRIVDISTAIQPAGSTADLRALTSSVESVGPVNDTVTCAAEPPPTGPLSPPCTVTVTATTLETPPNQAIGGGYNSTLSSDTVTITPLPNGQSILINFKLGVQKTGTFRFYIIVEALP